MNVVKKRRAANAGAVAAVALRILQDERLRAQLLDAGSAAASRARAWNERRRDDVIDLEPIAGGYGVKSPHPLPAVGKGRGAKRSTPVALLSRHQQLLVRVDRVGEAVEILRRTGSPETVASFADVDEAVVRLRRALEVAVKLPRARRSEVRSQVAQHLEELERSVSAATI